MRSKADIKVDQVFSHKIAARKKSKIAVQRTKTLKRVYSVEIKPFRFSNERNNYVHMNEPKTKKRKKKDEYGIS